MIALYAILLSDTEKLIKTRLGRKPDLPYNFEEEIVS